MVANVGTLTVRRQIGISLIEVITAIAILAVGIWAIVTLFPRGQDIIRRSGLRQQATQLAHEAISDFLADPAKMPSPSCRLTLPTRKLPTALSCLNLLTFSPSATLTTSFGAKS